MRNLSNRFFVLFLALLLTLSACLGACQRASEQGDGTAEGSDSSAASLNLEEILIFGQDTYIPVVYNVTKTPKDARNAITAAMKTTFNAFPTMEVDTKRPADTETVEILLGTTNRVESSYTAEVGKSDAWFFVGIVGRKLVITACNDYMLGQAVEYFISDILSLVKDGELVFRKENNHLDVWEDFTLASWKLQNLPYYKGDTVSFSSALFDSGTLITEKAKSNPSTCEMVSITRTNQDEFSAYLLRLEKYGFKETDRNTVEDNIYVTLTRGEERVYTYFTAPQKKVTVILETGGASTEEISNPITADLNKGAVFYQYGLNMHDGSATGNGYNNNGMLYVIRCADNSLIVIDGGNPTSFANVNNEEITPMEQFNRFLHEITGVEEGNKITIACWFLTHGHGDHASAFPDFLAVYKKQYELKSICANIPFSIMENNNIAGDLKSFGSFVTKNYPDCKEIKLHTGQQLRFADVTMDVLYTHEDGVSPAGISGFVTGDFNGTSTVAKFSVEGMSMLIVGDATSMTESSITQMFSEKTLSADIVQIAHHGFNYLPKLFAATGASYALIPQAHGYFVSPPSGSEPIHVSGMKANRSWLTAEIDQDKIFFAGDETYTVGLAYRNGQITMVCAPDAQHRLS